MKINELLQQKREEVLKLARQHGASRVRVFGSAARGEETEDRNMNLLTKMEELGSILVYNPSNASGDEAIPFEQAISAIENSQ